MEANLLIAIRLSKKRMLPAIAMQASKFPFREFFVRYLRIFFPLMDIPVKLPNSYQWYLEGSINNNSKTGAVFSELCAANIDPKSIWNTKRQKNTSLDRKSVV